MRSYGIILKLLFKNMFSFMGKKPTVDSSKVGLLSSLESKPKAKKISGAALGYVFGFGILYIVLEAFFIFTIYSLSPVMLFMGLENEFIAIIFATVSIVVLVFGLIVMLNYLYFSTDIEFFLNLPVKPSTVYMAKLSIVYITEIAVSAIVALPLLITFAVMAKLPALAYFMFIIGIFLAPSIPVMIASLLAIPLMFLVKFFKNKGAATSVLVLLLIGVFFALYFLLVFRVGFNAGENMVFDLEALRPIFVTMANVFYPYLAFARCATLSTSFGLSIGVSFITNLIIFIVSVAGLVGILVLVSSTIYRQSAAAQLENFSKNSKGNEVFRSNTAGKALLLKEWRELIRYPAFAFSSLMNIVIAPIMAVMFLLQGVLFSDMGGVGVELAFINNISWFITFFIVLMMSLGINLSSSTAISREGKNIAISKSLAVSYKMQAKAKLLLSNIISTVSILLSLIILVVLTHNFVNCFIAIVFTIIFGYGHNCLSLYIDLKKPKLNWTTPNEAVKQNYRTMIPFLIIFAFIIVFIIIAIVSLIFNANNMLVANVITWSVSFAIAIVYAFCCHKLLYDNVNRLYSAISI